MPSSIDPTQIFIRNWEIYQKIIQANYMKHQELGNHVQEYLKNFSSEKAIQLLDIGCGDAHQITNQLQHFTISSYTGYDLSAQAIAFAKINTEKLNTQISFQTGRMEELIKQDPKTYTILYSSFAIHHLTDEIKKDFINDCYLKLEEKGLFFLIDIKRQPGQSTEEYKESYSSWIQKEWLTLDKEEKIAIIDHLNTCDIPVEASTYISFASKAGFHFVNEVDIDPRHTLLLFSKS
jgi:2-polyprenyl-3-methyl-5-hydroxy-6-metoxy-1,4-benzoquinol methylase